MELTEKQVEDRLSDNTDEQLNDFLTEARRRVTEDKVVLNIGQLLEQIGYVETELERRRRLQA